MAYAFGVGCFSNITAVFNIDIENQRKCIILHPLEVQHEVKRACPARQQAP